MNQYSFYIVLVFFEHFSSSFSFSRRIAIILVLIFVLVIKIALLQSVIVCIVSEWILVVFAVASIGLIFALAFKSKEYPTNFALLAAFVSIVVVK